MLAAVCPTCGHFSPLPSCQVCGKPMWSSQFSPFAPRSKHPRKTCSRQCAGEMRRLKFRARNREVDENVVKRVLEGEKLDTNIGEKIAITGALTSLGWFAPDIANVLGITRARVTVYRREHRELKTMAVTSSAIRALAVDCVFDDKEVMLPRIEIASPLGNRYYFKPSSIERNYAKIVDFLSQLPETFREIYGGGSFLEVGQDRNGVVWTTTHTDMDALMSMGMGAGRIKAALPQGVATSIQTAVNAGAKRYDSSAKDGMVMNNVPFYMFIANRFGVTITTKEPT